MRCVHSEPAELGNNNNRLCIQIPTGCIHEAKNSRIHFCVETTENLLNLFLSVCPSHWVTALSPHWFSWAFVLFVVCLITEGQEVVLSQAI